MSSTAENQPPSTEDGPGPTANSCGNCGKAPPAVSLKRCAKCGTSGYVLYCGRDCQKADWKAHKKTCGKGPSTNPPSFVGGGGGGGGGDGLVKGLSQPINTPFTRLKEGAFLLNVPEKDVYRLLIDTYRLRMDDNYTFEGDADEDGLYGGAPSGLPGFQRFLRLAAQKKVLPPWWNANKQSEAEALGMGTGDDDDGWSNLRAVVEKSDIIEHYGNQRAPMMLRMLGEKVYGRGPGGQDGATMLEMMAGMEGGNGMYHTTLDASQMFRGMGRG